MPYFRRYLIALRRANNDGLFWNLPMFLGGLSVLAILLSILIDFLLPFNYFTNALKGFVAVGLGIMLFSSLYLFSSMSTEAKIENDRYYNPIRDRFSNKQRVNISIVIITIGGFVLLVSDPKSPIFTLKSGLFITLTLVMIAFARKQREEFLKDIYEIPDYRDMKPKKKIKKEEEEEEDK